MDPSNLIEVNQITDIFSFLKAIDWRGEWWLYGVGLFHVVVSLLAFLISVNFQIVLFSALLFMVYFSEFLNELAAKNSYRFSKQQYFDSNGLFISVIFCCPILINCIFLITRWLMLSFELMTKVKTEQLKRQIANQKKQQQSQATITSSSSSQKKVN